MALVERAYTVWSPIDGLDTPFAWAMDNGDGTTTPYTLYRLEEDTGTPTDPGTPPGTTARPTWLGIYRSGQTAAQIEATAGGPLGGFTVYWGGLATRNQASLQAIANAGANVLLDVMTKSGDARGTGTNAYIGNFALGSGTAYNTASAWIDTNIDSVITFANWLADNHPTRYIYVSCEHEYDVKVVDASPADQVYTGGSLDAVNGGRFINAFLTRLRDRAKAQGLSNIVLTLWWGAGRSVAAMNTIMNQLDDGLLGPATNANPNGLGLGGITSIDPYIINVPYETPSQVWADGLNNHRSPTGGNRANWVRLGSPKMAVSETGIAVYNKLQSSFPFTATQLGNWYTGIDQAIPGNNLEFVQIFFTDSGNRAEYDIYGPRAGAPSTAAAQTAVAAALTAAN